MSLLRNVWRTCPSPPRVHGCFCPLVRAYRLCPRPRPATQPNQRPSPRALPPKSKESTTSNCTISLSPTISPTHHHHRHTDPIPPRPRPHLFFLSLFSCISFVPPFLAASFGSVSPRCLSSLRLRRIAAGSTHTKDLLAVDIHRFRFFLRHTQLALPAIASPLRARARLGPPPTSLAAPVEQKLRLSTLSSLCVLQLPNLCQDWDQSS